MEKFLTSSTSQPNVTNKRARDGEISPDKWQQPKKFVTNAIGAKNKETPTSNRYKDLPVDAVEVAPDAYHQASKKKMANNTPVIIIELGSEWTHQKVKDVVEKYCKDYHMQYKGSKLVRLQCYSSKIHQNLKDGLNKEKVVYYTFTRKDEKLPKAVIKGLPKFVHSDLPTELESLGFPGANVTEFRTLHPSDCPPILVQFPSGTDMTKFKKIKYLSSCVVEIERYRPSKKSGTQCYRCQSFGHAARNCNRPPRCVKCAQSHLTWECTKKDRNTPALCCNCQENHPANYAKCSTRLTYISRLESRRDKLLITTIPVTANVKLAEPNSWARFSKTDKNSKQAPGRSKESNQLPPSGLIHSANPQTIRSTARPTLNTGATTGKLPQDLETIEILEILSTIQSIKQEFIKCETFFEKVSLILTHLGHYV